MGWNPPFGIWNEMENSNYIMTTQKYCSSQFETENVTLTAPVKGVLSNMKMLRTLSKVHGWGSPPSNLGEKERADVGPGAILRASHQRLHQTLPWSPAGHLVGSRDLFYNFVIRPQDFQNLTLITSLGSPDYKYNVLTTTQHSNFTKQHFHNNQLFQTTIRVK